MFNEENDTLRINDNLKSHIIRFVTLVLVLYRFTPNLGQGVCQAIEDAFVIANELHANEDVSEALKSYQEKRIKKATYITNTSWRFGQVANTTGMLKSILVSLLGSTPEAVNEKQLDKIYSASYFSLV